MKELWGYRQLIITLTIREIKIRYKQTIFGVGWAVIQPVAMMVIFTVIFSRFLHLDSENFPYPIFSYSALIFWTFFSTSLSFGPNSMLRMADLIKKIYFPREILPISAVLAALVDMLIASVIFVAFMIYYGIPFGPELLLVPPLVFLQILFTVGVVLLMSALNVYYRDIRHGIPFLVQAWMYATPIVFSMSKVPERYRPWYVAVNPMAGLIDGYRRIILHQMPPDGFLTLIVLAMAIIWLVMAYSIFKRMEGSFADVV
ncbi:MAG TPA: ABC transporter permease [bacterium]|nr:ABC transporter permease [bacterium]